VFADARDAFADFKRFYFNFIEIDDFAALAEAAFHEKSGERFLGFVGSREVDIPKIGTGFEKVKCVEESVWFVINFRHYAGTSGFPGVSFLAAPKRNVLAGGEFFGQTQDSAVAADEQRVGGDLDSDTSAGKPGSLNRHPEIDAVALPVSIV